MNLRPVAAATALQTKSIEVVATLPGFEVALAPYSFDSGGELLVMHEVPWNAVARCEVFTAIVTTKSVVQILT